MSSFCRWQVHRGTRSRGKYFLFWKVKFEAFLISVRRSNHCSTGCHLTKHPPLIVFFCSHGAGLCSHGARLAKSSGHGLFRAWKWGNDDPKNVFRGGRHTVVAFRTMIRHNSTFRIGTNRYRYRYKYLGE